MQRCRLGRAHTTGALASPASITPPDSPVAQQLRSATEGDASEATVLLLPHGPLSAADSGELLAGLRPGSKHAHSAPNMQTCMHVA